MASVADAVITGNWGSDMLGLGTAIIVRRAMPI